MQMAGGGRNRAATAARPLTRLSTSMTAGPSKPATFRSPATQVHYKDAHSPADLPPRSRRATAPAVARVNGAGGDAAAPDGGGPCAALCRHLAPPWRGAGLLESPAGR